MEHSSEFYTLKGYQTNSQNELTPAMEDYLEMISRLLQNQNVVRINELSEKLNVRPSSTTKTVQTLKELGYIEYEKYGYVNVTQKGKLVGDYLLYRHTVLHDFLCLLNHSDNELEQVEKIEHFLNRATIDNIRTLTETLRQKH